MLGGFLRERFLEIPLCGYTEPVISKGKQTILNDRTLEGFHSQPKIGSTEFTFTIEVGL